MRDIDTYEVSQENIKRVKSFYAVRWEFFGALFLDVDGNFDELGVTTEFFNTKKEATQARSKVDSPHVADMTIVKVIIPV